MITLRALFALGLASAALQASPATANILAEDPLPRFEDALCTGVMGLETGPALQFLDRIRHNAERLGVRLADPEKCSLNLVIAFVDDGRASVETLMKKQPGLFDSLSLAERRELLASDGPVRAWNVVATRTRDGMFVPRYEDMTQIPQTTMWSAHSKIYTATRQDILSSVVVFEGKQVAGLTVTQLADYATMRSLAADFSAYPQERGTILSLFGDEAGRPAELTQTDLAFLHDLYSGLPNIPARSKLRSIERRLGEDGEG